LFEQPQQYWQIPRSFHSRRLVFRKRLENNENKGKRRRKRKDNVNRCPAPLSNAAVCPVMRLQ
jgi:hypothetical protein